MIGALIHIVLDTAFVVVLAVIATIVFVIAWPFWYMRRRRARERCPEIALEVLNQRYAGEIGRSEITQNPDDILAAQVRKQRFSVLRAFPPGTAGSRHRCRPCRPEGCPSKLI